MTPAGRIVWRNVRRLGPRPEQRLGPGPEPRQRLLLVAPAADDLPARLAQEGLVPETLCLSQAAHERMLAAGLQSGFGLTPTNSSARSRIVLFQPREKALLDMLLELCASLLDRAGELWLTGENRAGIKSAGKRLAERFARHSKLDSARHCTLFCASETTGQAAFSLDDHVTEWPLDVAGRSLTVCSLPGVFAHGRLDAGTRLLLNTLASPRPASPVSGRVLDFACGSGAIGLALAVAHPRATLTLLDDSAPALESARRSFTKNGLEARLVASDGLLTLLREGGPAFDWIVSNPPFHAGVHLETGIARRFLRDCPRLLAPGGRLCLVANAHLPYSRWLPELFGSVQVLAADREYNVWLASGLTPGAPA